MAVEINGIELTNVHRIVTLESGGYVQQKVPGMEGDITQDLGRQSLQLQIDGIFYGTNKEVDLKALRSLYLKREPVEFLAQITGQAYAARVVINSLRVMESGDQTDQFTYELIVVEYIEPPEAGILDANKIDELVKAEALQVMELMEIPDMLSMGSIPELSNPTEPLKSSLGIVQQASGEFLGAVSGIRTLLGNKK